MFETIKNCFKVKEIRRKIWITLLLLLVFRIGCYIPVPGIDAAIFGEALEQYSFLELMSSITGSSLSNATLFALGISPYINASIIIQLLTVGIPALERLSREGEEGRRKIAQITRYVTIVLAIAQAIGIIVNIAANTEGAIRVVMFGGDLNALWILLGFFVLTILEFTAIVAVDLSERRIPVQYAKQVKGRKMYGGQSTVIPIRIAGGGVMPLIFAFAIISFPGMLASLFWPGSGFEQGVAEWFSGSSTHWYGQLIYLVTLCILIFAFSFFYSSMQFNPEDVSKTIQQNGGFIQGIRPGKPTADYLKKISNRITLFGAIYLTLVALVPSILSIVVVATGITTDTSLLSVFSTTGILIVVSVALELDKQLQSQLMMKNYKGFLK